MYSLVQLAHQHVRQHLHDGVVVIDATLGNGHDTLFLARHIAPRGTVYGFDIQAQALANTARKLELAGLLPYAHLFLQSHAKLNEYIPLALHGRIGVIMFNLGYLPGSDKDIITQTDSTLHALNAAIQLLAPQGLLSILAYPGHPGGADETIAVENWADSLTNAFNYELFYGYPANIATPRLLLLKKN